MDERLKKALEFSNFMVTLDNQLRNLREKFNQDTIYYHNGGQFTVTKELISFCDTMVNKNQKTIVLVDDNEMPVQIEDLEIFVDNLVDNYVQSSNSFLNDYNILRKKRSVEFIIGES